MGLELKKCNAEIKGQTFVGNLHIDSNEFEFRAPELRWSVKVGKGTSAKIHEGKLRVRRGTKSATFLIGTKAEKWADKILHPPNRATKLGLKPGLTFVLRGKFETSFKNELIDQGLKSVRTINSCEIAFVMMWKSSELKLLEKVLSACQARTHVWAVWPKGIDAVRQGEVIATARTHGLGPGKGIAFDEICSAMRFTKKK